MTSPPPVVCRSYSLLAPTALSQPFELDGSAVYLGVSIGSSIYPRDGNNATELLRHAEATV